MKEIQLTQNKVAIVDDEDYEYLNKFKWHFSKRKSNGQSAALAYDEKAKELFKEFACTNFGSINSPYILITT